MPVTIPTRRRAVLTAAALLGLACPPPSAAQRGPAPAAPATFDTSAFSALKWRNIGPNRGGRSIAAAGSPSRPLEYYFGATGGGLWKTRDGGTTWKPVSDSAFTSSSVGAVAVCAKNPDVVYAGLGETELRGNIMQGDGIYRSADGGKTWTHAGLDDTHAIARVRIDPDDCDRVYVAALGHPYGPNADRGVFRTADGGRTWSKVLFRGDRAGAVDLALTPGNARVMYAGLWEVNRTPWSLSSGGPGSGVFKSADGGDTWTELTRNPGMPAGILGKVGIAVSGANPNRVWAIVEAAEGGVFRSDDAGATWTRVNSERKLRQRAFYYTRIYADPKDTATVYVLNTSVWKSTDGGRTFPKAIRVPHGDNHDLWIDPADPRRMIEANDGGANVSVTGGESWTDQDYPTAQMYHVAVTRHFPYHVCGAQQDNSTACVESDGNGSRWYEVGGGESGYVAPDPRNGDVFYAGSYGGLLTRLDRRTGQERNVQVWPENPMGHSAADIRERFQWTYPIVFSATDPRVLYTGSQHLWRSANEGQTWERISPDLTRGDPKTLGPSGGPITLDQTGVETYGTIFTIAPSPRDGAVIWVGSDDGKVQVTRDGGGHWADVTPAALGEFARISLIEASPHQAGRAYVAANRYQMEDRAPYIFRTDDFGATWTRITTGIPAGDFARAVREDPVRPGLLYAGTEHGAWVSWDDGAHWRSLRLGLPDVQVADLIVVGNDVIAATHGRSFYVLDHAALLRQLAPAAVDAPSFLFAPDDAVRGSGGLNVFYTLKRPARRVTLDFLDANGAVIRSFTGTPGDTAKAPAASGDDDEDGPPRGRDPKVDVTAGMHRFVWNLRYPGPADFPKMVLWAARLQGPVAVPGAYSVRLTVDGRTQTQPFRVLKDPRLTDVTQADLEAGFRLAMQIRDRTSEANRAVMLIRGLREQIDARVKDRADAELTAAADSLRAHLAAVEEEIYQTRLQSSQDPLNYPIRLNNQIAALQGVVESAQQKPTDVSFTVFQELSTRLAAQRARLDAIVATELPRFNELLRARRLARVAPSPLA
ncbi:MAG TPA: hypothetical protein VFE05_10675 [Longimicrobiaceae bacterium]|jgi:photosystem II stability/assembly factor-like uncharacterized protein|nr:hypothetical protein [Longimicrobiaceae bacterium]